ncbi:MAG: hypothetical protein QOJ96_1326 [Alphaproteobacteria bacterium]|jgi:regulator of replication initiation timing|nr:hypothetical protein [Alphaproteobacteria bacterium]
MAAWFDSVVAPLKIAVEATQKFVETRDEIKVQELKVTLFRQISDAYNAAFAFHERETALRAENETLKKRLMDREELDARKACYELQTLPPGVVVCSLKSGIDAARNPQRACHTCYENGKISALNSRGIRHGLEALVCNACGCEVKTGYFQPPQPVQTRTRYNPLRRGS